MSEFAKITERKCREYPMLPKRDDDGNEYSMKVIPSNRPGYKITIDQVGEDGIEMSIPMNQKTQQFMTCLEIMATRDGYKSNEVFMTLEDYMEMTGEKNSGRAIKAIKSSLMTLIRTKFCFPEKIKKKNGEYVTNEMWTTILQSFSTPATDDTMSKMKVEELYKNGVVTAQFSDKVFNLLKRGSDGGMVYYPDLCFSINTRLYPCAREMMEYVQEQKRINIGNGQEGRNHEDLLTVKSILSNCYQLPTKQELLAKKDRHTDKRIVEPFFANMAALEEVVSFEYFHDDGRGGIGEPYTEAESLCDPPVKYDDFITTHVKVNWSSYPDCDELIKQRKLHAENARSEKKKERARKAKGA